MRVADVLKEKGRELVTVRVTESLKEAIARLDHERIGATLVVNDDGHLAGMLSERDLIGVLAEYGDRALRANVGALMTRRIFACRPDDSLSDALAWMTEHRVRHLPVVEEDVVCGLISIGDVAKHMMAPTDAEPLMLKSGTVPVAS